MSIDVMKLVALTKAKPTSSGWIGHCLCHDDKTPSFSFEEKDGKLVYHCHAGCSSDVIWKRLKEDGIITKDDHVKKSSATNNLIQKIIKGSQPITPDNLAGKYLQSRSIDLNIVGDDLLFNPEVWHSDTKSNHPCLIGIIRKGNEIIGLHRTYLTQEGKKLNINPKKVLGEMKGGYICV